MSETTSTGPAAGTPRTISVTGLPAYVAVPGIFTVYSNQGTGTVNFTVNEGNGTVYTGTIVIG